MSTKVDLKKLRSIAVKSSKSARSARIQRARTHEGFDTFCEIVLRDDETNDTIKIAPHQREWISFIQKELDWDWIEGKKRLFEGRYFTIMAPWKSGKPLHVDTPIQMADGHCLPIGDIKVGDYVISHHGRPRKTIGTFNQGLLPCLEIKTESKRTVIAAGDHPFLTLKGWTLAQDLNVDDKLVLLVDSDYKTEYEPIIEINKIGEKECRCISVEEDETYLANDFIVHNTPVFAKAFPLWLWGFNRNLRITMVCNSDSNATNRCMSIGGMLQESKDLREVFPDIEPDTERPWNKSQLNIVRNTNPNDHSLQAYSVESSVTGLTIDVLLLDDVCDEEDTKSEAIRKSRRNKINRGWVPRLRPGGGMIGSIGTRWHAQDVWGMFLENPNFDVLVQGIDEDIKHIEQPPDPYRRFDNVVDSKKPKKIPLWDRMPKVALERIRNNDLLSYNAGMRQRPQLEEEQLFDNDAVTRAFRWDMTWQDIIATNRAGRPSWPLYEGVDLSGEGRKGTVLAVVAVRPTDGLHVIVSLRRGAWGFGPKVADQIYADYMAYQPRFIAVESNAAQESLVDWMQRIYGVDFPAIKLRTGLNKIDAEVGIPGLALDINRDKWVIPCGDINAHYQKRNNCPCGRCTFYRDLIDYPNGTMDCLMAVFQANRAASNAINPMEPGAIPIQTQKILRAERKPIDDQGRSQRSMGINQRGGLTFQRAGKRIFSGPGRRYF